VHFRRADSEGVFVAGSSDANVVPLPFQRDAGVDVGQRPVVRADGLSGTWSLNMPLKDATSNYIRHVRPTLAAFVDLLCGQTSNDYGSNKVLLPAAF